MPKLTAKDITKSIIIAIVAVFLFIFVFLLWFWGILTEMAYYLIDHLWFIDSYEIVIHVVPLVVSLIISGLLMGVFIGFVAKNNRMLTAIITLLFTSIVFIILLFNDVQSIPSICDKHIERIRLSLQYILSLSLLIGCTLFGVWLVSRWKRKMSAKVE
jgi:hypothetical protein